MLSILCTLLFTLLTIGHPLSPRQVDERTYVVHNNCPGQINLFVGGDLDAVLPAGGKFSEVASTFAGFWYTDANGGRYTGVGTTRAAFWGDSYGIIKDPGGINTGMTVVPRHAPTTEGFCTSIACEDSQCRQGFTGIPGFPNDTSPLPYHHCPFNNTTFDITFCPNGIFPANAGAEIHPNSDSAKCLDVRGANFANGTPVQIYDCNGTGAQKWFYVRGSTKVQVAGTNFCLDAGSSPASGVGLKIWQCYDGLAAQQWYYTNDNRIALEGKGQCMDLTNGVLANGNQVQTWQCTDFNANQIWNPF
ncbi:ricin B lectin domain-containing protein [Flammula alnicola]|nr:ricin B lectin domain-containing protein [Flammula alnicola]